MRRTAPALLALFGLAVLAGCSSMTVNYDYDADVDFSRYRTFAWMPRGTEPPETAAEAQLSGDLLGQRIRAAVEGELAQRGLAQVEGAQADLLVVYHVGTQEKIQITDWGYRYSDYYWGYGGRQLDVYQYTQGTLVIDLVDARTKQLVWRGTGSKTIDRQQRSPQEEQARIDEAVAKIMESFPPR